MPCLSLLALTVFQLNAKFDFKLNWIHNPFPKSRYRPCAYIQKTKSRRHNSKSNLHKIFSFPLPFSYTVCKGKSVYHKRKCSLPFSFFYFHSQTSNNPFFPFHICICFKLNQILIGGEQHYTFIRVAYVFLWYENMILLFSGIYHSNSELRKKRILSPAR